MFNISDLYSGCPSNIYAKRHNITKTLSSRNLIIKIRNTTGRYRINSRFIDAIVCLRFYIKIVNE